MPVVLVVDDEALIRWSLSERLAEEGYTVRQASSGAEAVAVLAALAGRRVIVVLDIRLPDVNDLELFRRIRADRPEVPVIVMTAHGSPEDAREALASGAIGFIGKPFDVARMLALVGKARAESAGPS